MFSLYGKKSRMYDDSSLQPRYVYQFREQSTKIVFRSFLKCHCIWHIWKWTLDGAFAVSKITSCHSLCCHTHTLAHSASEQAPIPSHSFVRYCDEPIYVLIRCRCIWMCVCVSAELTQIGWMDRWSAVVCIMRFSRSSLPKVKMTQTKTVLDTLRWPNFLSVSIKPLLFGNERS